MDGNYKVRSVRVKAPVISVGTQTRYVPMESKSTQTANQMDIPTSMAVTKDISVSPSSSDTRPPRPVARVINAHTPDRARPELHIPDVRFLGGPSEMFRFETPQADPSSPVSSETTNRAVDAVENWETLYTSWGVFRK